MKTTMSFMLICCCIFVLSNAASINLIMPPTRSIVHKNSYRFGSEGVDFGSRPEPSIPAGLIEMEKDPESNIHDVGTVDGDLDTIGYRLEPTGEIDIVGLPYPLLNGWL